MSVNVTVNGSSYVVPQTSEAGWGDNLTSWIQAISSTSLQKTGGVFTLTGEADFGATFGLKALYLKTETASSAATGVLRLANADGVAWRNVGNTADLTLKPGSADGILSFNSIDIPTISSTHTLTNKSIDATTNTLSNISNSSISASAAIAYSKLNLAASIVNADISGSAAIAYSKLNLATSIVNADISASAAIARTKIAAGSASQVVVNDGSGNLTSVAALTIANGGTGQTTASAAAGALLPAQASNGGKFLTTDGTSTLSWASVTAPALTVSTKTTTYTVLSSDDVILADATTAAFTITLPAASAVSGKVYRFKKIDSSANRVTISRAGSDTLDAATTRILGLQYDSLEIVSNGTTWYVPKPEAIVCQVAKSATSTFNAGQTTLFDTIDVDTHNAYATGTGLWTAPYACTVLVSASITRSGGGTGTWWNLNIQKNGVTQRTSNGEAVSSDASASLSAYVKVASGDTISVQTFSNGSQVMYADGAVSNWMTITRAGF